MKKFTYNNTIFSILLVIIPLTVLWNENKEPDMAYYTVYILNEDKEMLASYRVNYPDTTFHYSFDTESHDSLYFYVTATDTAGNESLPSDTVMYSPDIDHIPFLFSVSEPYPSITNGQFNIIITSMKNIPAQITIYNTIGQVFYRKQIQVLSGGYVYGLNMPSVSGMYFLAIKANKRIIVRKLLLIK